MLLVVVCLLAEGLDHRVELLRGNGELTPPGHGPMDTCPRRVTG